MESGWREGGGLSMWFKRLSLRKQNVQSSWPKLKRSKNAKGKTFEWQW